MAKPGKSMVKAEALQTEAGPVEVGSPAWFDWLANSGRFSFQGKNGHFTAQREMRRGSPYWYAYRRREGKLLKHYLGKTAELTLERLEQAGAALAGLHLLDQYGAHPSGERPGGDAETRIDSSVLPVSKVSLPALPPHLVTRPRLTRQITAPLTLIYAPSGFGKTTLLNDWARGCGRPVAWLALDEGDNQPLRFWQSVIQALQTIHPGFGSELLAELQTAAPVHLPDVVAWLSRELLRIQAESENVAESRAGIRSPTSWRPDARPTYGLSLVLDDFQHINHPEIYDTLRAWLEQFPPNLQLVISGHTRPALPLGHLRAQGFVGELDAGELRFTLQEGIDYLRQYPQEPPLAYSDLEKLVRHSEGWAAGLTLTALALGKQEDPRRFIDTFSGAHIYLREYFMETVLEHSSPAVQSFLLKTAVLKHLTGSLCDAVTGRSDGEEMLARLWQENLFIVRLEEPGWYRYHDLFAEMLHSQLQARFPEEVSALHQRAAQWHLNQNAPADAVPHLLAINAWDDASALIEAMALRELEQYGEDSRLLHWLQELPEDVVQQHKTLLFVYLRLAEVALPRQKIEGFVARIEANLSAKPAWQQTGDEREVLVEIQRIRRAWQQGDPFTPPALGAGENDARWEVLDGLRLLKHAYSSPEPFETQAETLLRKAQAQPNLFVVLMIGGALARRALVSGQLRRSARIARQVLEQALALRGKLPEPTSIALAVLAQTALERGELDLAQKYLAQADEVDPNPTSTNMLVQTGLLRAWLQAAQGKPEEALASLQATRALHDRRPSGIWSDQDLIAYHALLHLRVGDLAAAEALLGSAEAAGEHHLTALALAEILLEKGQPAAEPRLRDLLARHPHGMVNEPNLPARVLLALALFKQHKVNQALQAIGEAVRSAAPEGFTRPFRESAAGLSGGAGLAPLLLLALKTERLTGEAQAFIQGLLDAAGESARCSPAEMQALSVSASISQREQAVLALLSSGCSNREIAAQLSISASTVKTHLENIYTKLDVNSRTQAVKRAGELNLV